MKRGLSPLIAVILLIGFTILLGALISQSGFFDQTIGGATEIYDKTLYCETLNFNIKSGCYGVDGDENPVIKLLIENVGEVKLENGFKAKIFLENEIIDIPTFPDVAIEKFGSENINLFFSLNEETRIELIPRIKDDKKIDYCRDSSESFILKECE